LLIGFDMTIGHTYIQMTDDRQTTNSDKLDPYTLPWVGNHT